MKLATLVLLFTSTTALSAAEEGWNNLFVKKKEPQEICCYEEECCCEEYSCDCSCCCLGTFTVGGEWLYLSPRETDTEYARLFCIEETGVPIVEQGTRKCLNWKFHSGYEIFASYQGACCDPCYLWDIRGSFTSYKQSEKILYKCLSTSIYFPSDRFYY